MKYKKWNEIPMEEWKDKDIDDFVAHLMEPVTRMMVRRVRHILEAAASPPATEKEEKG